MTAGGVAVDARAALLEDRHDEDDAELLRERLHALGRRPRNRLGEIEALALSVDLAEVRRVEELLEADDLRAARAASRMPRSASSIAVALFGETACWTSPIVKGVSATGLSEVSIR